MAARIEDEGLGLFLVLLVLCVAVLFFNSPGTIDVPLFMDWMGNIRWYGIVAGYAANQSVQPPLYAVFFWAIAKAAQWVGAKDFIAYKCSLLLAWLLTGLCLRQWTRSSVAISLVLLALIPNSLALGYFDIYLAPPLLLALWAAREKRWALFSTSFAIFAMTKAQGLILIPFASIFAAKIALNARRTQQDAAAVAVKLATPAALLGVLLLGVFGGQLIAAIQYASDTHYFSGNALNLCWVLTHYIQATQPGLFGGLQPDGTATFIWSPEIHGLEFWIRIVFFTVYGLILLAYARRTASLRDFVYYSLLGYLAYFVLNTGVHENHLFCAVILSAVLFLIDDRYLSHAVICCVAANVNLVLFYGLTGSGLPFSRVVGIDLAVVFAGLNVVFFVVAVAPVFWRQLAKPLAADS